MVSRLVSREGDDLGGHDELDERLVGLRAIRQRMHGPIDGIEADVTERLSFLFGARFGHALYMVAPVRVELRGSQPQVLKRRPSDLRPIRCHMEVRVGPENTCRSKTTVRSEG